MNVPAPFRGFTPYPLSFELFNNRMNTREILEIVKQRNPNEPEFIQAAEEVITSIVPVLEKNPAFVKLKLLERNRSV